mmetsp:Transcript_26849/g.53618  ORF Transcript_26849/g.53618 Transcript_26849/m.53618 type:complete len:227 (-) Transcript_26849:62-742(-)
MRTSTTIPLVIASSAGTAHPTAFNSIKPHTGIIRDLSADMNTICIARRRWRVLEKLDPTQEVAETYRLFMGYDGTFPNNPDHPLLLFRGSSKFTGDEKECRRTLRKAGWTAPWKWIVFPYHHYHSSAWELLLCVQGAAVLKLGGETGPEVKIGVGDIMLIPPGFVHKQLASSDGFSVLGSYPSVIGKDVEVDELRGTATEEQLENILSCCAPEVEPITGSLLSSSY